MFCKNCGKELANENAYICTACGCLIGEQTKKNRPKKEKAVGENVSSSAIQILAKLLMLCAFTCICVSVMLIVVGLCNLEIYIVYYNSWLEWDSGCCIATFVFALIASVFAVANVIITFVCEKGFTTLKLLSIMIFIASSIAVVQGIMFLTIA